MSWLGDLIWFGAACFGGKLVMSLFGTQIGIILRCTNKLLKRIENDHEFWDSSACKKYLRKIIIINSTILLAVSALVVCFLPVIGINGYFIGLLGTCVFSFSAMGVNKNNLEESCQIFLKFALPGMDKEMAELLPMLADQLLFENILRGKTKTP